MPLPAVSASYDSGPTCRWWAAHETAAGVRATLLARRAGASNASATRKTHLWEAPSQACVDCPVRRLAGQGYQRAAGGVRVVSGSEDASDAWLGGKDVCCSLRALALGQQYRRDVEHEQSTVGEEGDVVVYESFPGDDGDGASPGATMGPLRGTRVLWRQGSGGRGSFASVGVS